MALKTISVVLTGNATSLRGALIASAREVETFGNRVDSMGQKTSAMGAKIAAGFAVAGAAVAAGLAVAERLIERYGTDPARSRVWALGFRNPYRCVMRPGTGSTDPAAANPGSVYVGDVGWADWEELSVCTAAGQNFGWPLYQGLQASDYHGTFIQNPDAPNPFGGYCTLAACTPNHQDVQLCRGFSLEFLLVRLGYVVKVTWIYRPQVTEIPLG